ncbi:MAG: hypothetical protein ABI586_07145 [Candidatus Nanopelagicales bacterium]
MTSAPAPQPTALDSFFQNLEARTDLPSHQRLLAAARKKDPARALELELTKIVTELLRED